MAEFIEESNGNDFDVGEKGAEFYARADAAEKHYLWTGEFHTLDEVAAHLRAMTERRRKQVLG